MEYKRFIQLMDEPGNVESETVASLQELIKEFPYFQSAHLLLARSMKEQEHIRYERQLKLASAYAPDRKVLYSLLNDKKNKKEVPVLSPEKEIPSPFILVDGKETDTEEHRTKRDTLISNPFIEPSTPIPNLVEDATHSSRLEVPEGEDPGQTKEIISEPSKEISHREAEVADQTFVPAAENATTDPREILKRRLSEILGNTEKESEDESLTEKKKSDNTESVSVKASELTDDLGEILAAEEMSESHVSPQKSPVQAANVLDTQSVPPEPKFPVHPPADSLSELLPEDTSKPLDAIEKLELEYAMEDTLLSSLEKLPVIEGVERPREAPAASAEKKADLEEESTQSDDISSPRSFRSWLQKLSGKEFGQFEIVHADDAPAANSAISHAETSTEPFSGESKSKDESAEPSRKVKHKENPKASDNEGLSLQKKELIDKFIATEPKIIPSKIEFYSPVTQAKRSLEEYDDVVSETLASIYRQQGNNLKARFCYEKLSLYFPEKRTYFAALIKEIDEELNRSNQEDL